MGNFGLLSKLNFIFVFLEPPRNSLASSIKMTQYVNLPVNHPCNFNVVSVLLTLNLTICHLMYTCNVQWLVFYYYYQESYDFVQTVTK